ncbi:adenosine receptor A3 [Aplysia californica]|uniref:Adenosine receptor A3 n=1 Tax=Aplysia californica TaxID=6500 RepID=A0ABM0KAR7_APLCA|nr:adenosine receptor A3 [Aplysia californica]
MKTTDIVYISAEVIVGLISIVGNIIVVAAILKTARLHTVTNVFITNLAIADIVVGFLVAPCAALSSLGVDMTFYGCVLMNSLILMFTNVSILMLLGVAFERFFAIKKPFVYQRVLTVRRAVYANILIWVLGFLLGLVPMYGWNAGYYEHGPCFFTNVITMEYMVYFQFFGLVLAPLFLMLCVYMYILRIVRRHQRQTNTLQNMFRGQPGQDGHHKDNFHKDVRAAKLFALVILLFGIFWLPVNIFNCVTLFCSGCNFPIEALLAAIVMSHANSSINPFIYAASNSRIKNAILDLFGFKPSGQTEDSGGLGKGRQSSFSHATFHATQTASTHQQQQQQQQQPPVASSQPPFSPRGGKIFTVSKNLVTAGPTNAGVVVNDHFLPRPDSAPRGDHVTHTTVEHIHDTCATRGTPGQHTHNTHNGHKARDVTPPPPHPLPSHNNEPPAVPPAHTRHVTGHVNAAFTLDETCPPSPGGSSSHNNNNNNNSHPTTAAAATTATRAPVTFPVVPDIISARTRVTARSTWPRRQRTYRGPGTWLDHVTADHVTAPA